MPRSVPIRVCAKPIWGTAMTEPLLHVRNLQAWYGESHVLQGVDLDVHAGELVALLGRNGAGKTTTMKAIMGILRQRRGTIRFRGEDIASLPLHKVARLGLGFVPEERGIFGSLCVAENLTLPPAFAPAAFSMAEIHALFPNLGERLRSGGLKLSGGEQQMLAIARILRTGARLLLLDEPTEGLAPVIVDRIAEAIRALKARGITILMVEQNFRFAASIADRFLVMEGGVIVDGFSRSELDSRRASLTETLGL
jgi:branched-chain amino acid transport system ATP-binding protein